MLLLALVIDRRALLHGLGQTLEIKLGAVRHGEELFAQADQVTAIAVGHFEQALARGRVQRQRLADMLFGPFGQNGEIGGLEAAQRIDLGARQERRDHREARVFGGRADEDHRAILDMGQQCILGGSVEAVQLVDEHHRLPPCPFAQALGRLDDLAQIRDTRQHGRKLDEIETDLLGDQPRDRGLADTGWSPEDEGRHTPRGDHATDRPGGTQQMVLPDDVGEPCRAQRLCEGARCGIVKQ